MSKNQNPLELQVLSQQLGNMQQQLESLSHQLTELERIKEDLNSLENQKASQSFSPLGGGIFIETETKESNQVLLSVGSNILVKKDKKEAIGLIEKQVVDLRDIKSQIENEMNKLNMHLLSLR